MTDKAERPKAEREDLLKEAREAFERAQDYESENRTRAMADIKFARLGEQWPEAIRKQRKRKNQPCLTINKQPAFIRQVVNDSRQNKPQIRVHPVDGGADKRTADAFSGVIRNIEYTSSADTAYDWSVECAVSGGFGYFRVGLDYAHDDTFDMDVSINRVLDPFSIYGDPHATAADGSDWDSAFVIDVMSKAAFARKHHGKDAVDWDALGYTSDLGEWFTEDQVRVAEWWRREEIERDIVRFQDGTVIDKERLSEPVVDGGPTLGEILAAQGLEPNGERKAKTWKVTQTTLTGAEELDTRPWKGRFIPLVPVYGDEVYAEGKRIFRSLIHDAKDAQQNFNYWRSAATEMVALAPKAPFIGPKGAFKSEADKWATANTESHAYLEYDGPLAPQRQPFPAAPAGMLQEALNASDDMKAIIGIYDASLGARSNETSGRAIMARQREGDVSTFHFADNMSRAIRHAGRILIDLIPHYYGRDRVIRIIGEDGEHEMIPLGKPVPVKGPDGKPEMREGAAGPEPVTHIYDLTAGKYDLTVSTGPSFTTRREEAAAQMTELIRAFPAAAPVLGDILAKNLDWPEADKVAERLKAMLPPQASDGVHPEIQQMMDQGKELIAKLQAENQKLQAEAQKLQAEAQSAKMDKAVEAERLKIEGFEAETDRMRAVADMQAKEQEQAQVAATETNQVEQQDRIGEALMALADALSRPKMIIRGPDGLATGVQ